MPIKLNVTSPKQKIDPQKHKRYTNNTLECGFTFVEYVPSNFSSLSQSWGMAMSLKEKHELKTQGLTMSKQAQFLSIVQTVFLSNQLYLSLPKSSPAAELAGRHSLDLSPVGTLIFMDDALHASERIPERLSAFDAAHQFCCYALENLREPGASPPFWFSRYHTKPM
jgi:hypothetical protein